MEKQTRQEMETQLKADEHTVLQARELSIHSEMVSYIINHNQRLM
jgi:hypothetical protein